jgi:uncharacterized LabA/DUF88 family protein
MRLRIFVDYWNFTISSQESKQDKNYRVDYKKLSPWILNKTKELLNYSDITFEETRVYLSYNPRKIEDKPLKNWATNDLDRFPGIKAVLMERKIKNTPVCPNCHKELSPCPYCDTPTNGTIEKGVDTTLVTDLIGFAWENTWEVAVLLSSDRDFIPAMELLNKKSKKVINGHFPPKGMELAKNCWASFDISKALDEIELVKK